MDRKSLMRLSGMVSVRDVMTNGEYLRRADTPEEAGNLFHEYDVVPYPRRGKIEGFFRRTHDDITPLEVEHLLSADTSILQVPALLRLSKCRCNTSTTCGRGRRRPESGGR